MAGRLTRGDVVLVHFAPPAKQRPALVLTRAEMIPSLTRITIAPLTSTIRGVYSEVVLGVEDGLKAPCAVNLFNITTVPKAALGRRLATLDDETLRRVCAAIGFSLGCGESGSERPGE